MTFSDLKKADLSTLTGIGPKAKESYHALGVESVADLITFMPKGYEDRSKRVCIGYQVPDGQWTNTIVTVISKSFFGKGLKNVKATVVDTQSGVRGEILGFNRSYLDHVLFVGSTYSLYANQMPSNGYRYPQFSQFEIKAVTSDFDSIESTINPIYPLAGCLTENSIRRDIRNALARTDSIDDDLPDYILEKYHLISRDEAIRKLHFPKTVDDIKISRRTLAFSEVFYMQLLAMRKSKIATRRSTEKKIYQIEQDFISSLPFDLTEDQKHVLDEIRTDMSQSQNMNRLLQGDVGCGKTVVAWISALHAIAEGRQVAFMAPTELLARQHAQSAAKLFEKTGISIAFLDSEVKPNQRKTLLDQLKKGNIQLLIGTHALFSKDVEYQNLGYVIIDEQHRFGVEQRASLFQKGENPDILLMTATPIPRTLAMTIYGNLNVSTIKTLPHGRLPIKTFTVDNDHKEAMYQAVGKEFERSHQAYFVYPRIEPSEEENREEVERQNIKDVTTMFTLLSERYSSYKGALIHSKLPDDQKIKILNDFTDAKLDFLVATSVVEVGLDVPKATIMVVEHSENFGLSALHQLRGRVGRSSLQSWCFLSHESPLTDDAKKRLSVLKRTNDGFEIAEEDLKIRGPGEITGLRQSGFNNMKFASLDKDIAMMSLARDEVKNILEKDPGLLDIENAVIRQTLGELKPCLQ